MAPKSSLGLLSMCIDMANLFHFVIRMPRLGCEIKLPTYLTWYRSKVGSCL